MEQHSGEIDVRRERARPYGQEIIWGKYDLSNPYDISYALPTYAKCFMATEQLRELVELQCSRRTDRVLASRVPMVKTE